MPKILIPLDADPASMTTMAGARAIMGNRPWTVRLIHSGADPDREMRAYLDDAAARLQAEGHFVTIVMAEGPSDAATTLQRASISPRMDIVVLTRQGSGNGWLDAKAPVELVRRPLFCPVMIMPPEVAAAPGYKLGHIVVALDGSTTAELGVDLSLTLAERLGARITVMTAVEREREAAADGDKALPALTSATDAASYLDGVSQRYADRVRFGQAVKDSGQATSEAIVEAARERRADLVILTSQGTSGARKEGLGRVAEIIAQTSSVPVMIARPTPTSKVPFGRGALLKKR